MLNILVSMFFLVNVGPVVCVAKIIFMKVHHSWFLDITYVSDY